MTQLLGGLSRGAAAASPRGAEALLSDAAAAAAASGTSSRSGTPASPLLSAPPSDAVAPWGLPPALDLAVLVEAAEKLDLLLLAPLLPVIHHFLWLLPTALSKGEGSLPTQQQQQQQPSRRWLSPQLAASITRLLRLRNHPALTLRNRSALTLSQGTASRAAPNQQSSAITGPCLGLAATCALCILEELHQRLAVLGLGDVECSGKDDARIQGAVPRGVSAAAADGDEPAGIAIIWDAAVLAGDVHQRNGEATVADDATATTAEDAGLHGCSVTAVRLMDPSDPGTPLSDATAITGRYHQGTAQRDDDDNGREGGGGLSACDLLIDTRFLELCCPSLAEACRTLERSAAAAAGVCGGGSSSSSTQGGPQGGASKAAAVVPRKLSVRPIGAVGSPSSFLASPSKLPSFSSGSGAISSASPASGDIPESLRKMLHPDDGIDGQQVRFGKGSGKQQQGGLPEGEVGEVGGAAGGDGL